MKRILVVAAVLAVVGCANYEVDCAQTYGFQAGTPEFFNCVQQLEQARQARIQNGLAQMNRGMNMMNAQPTPMAPTTRCLTTQQGIFTQTQCQ